MSDTSAIDPQQVDRLAKQQAELATKVDDLYLIQRAVLEGRLNLQ